jgi:hypothetical protein
MVLYQCGEKLHQGKCAATEFGSEMLGTVRYGVNDPAAAALFLHSGKMC